MAGRCGREERAEATTDGVYFTQTKRDVYHDRPSVQSAKYKAVINRTQRTLRAAGLDGILTWHAPRQYVLRDWPTEP